MNEDLFIKKIIKLEEDVAWIKEKVAKIDTLDAKFDRVMNTLDGVVGKFQTNEEERTIMHYDLKKVEEKTVLNTVDLAKIKVQLKIA